MKVFIDAASVAEYAAISEAPEVLGNHQLHPSDAATTVRVQDGGRRP